jgi:hypothetical protein
MLLVELALRPLECLGETLCLQRLPCPQTHPREKESQLEGDRLIRRVLELFEVSGEQGVAKLGGEEEGLEQRVHVTGAS